MTSNNQQRDLPLRQVSFSKPTGSTRVPADPVRYGLPPAQRWVSAQMPDSTVTFVPASRYRTASKFVCSRRLQRSEAFGSRRALELAYTAASRCARFSCPVVMVTNVQADSLHHSSAAFLPWSSLGSPIHADDVRPHAYQDKVGHRLEYWTCMPTRAVVLFHRCLALIGPTVSKLLKKRALHIFSMYRADVQRRTLSISQTVSRSLVARTSLVPDAAC